MDQVEAANEEAFCTKSLLPWLVPKASNSYSRSLECWALHKEMEILMLRAEITEDWEATMASFLNGLRLEIAEQVELQHYVELGDLVEKAIKIERRLKRRGQPWNYTTLSPSYTRTSLPKKEEKGTTSSMPSKPRQESTKWESKTTLKLPWSQI